VIGVGVGVVVLGLGVGVGAGVTDGEEIGVGLGVAFFVGAAELKEIVAKAMANKSNGTRQSDFILRGGTGNNAETLVALAAGLWQAQRVPSSQKRWKSLC
jgi:hypothetical protein